MLSESSSTPSSSSSSSSSSSRSCGCFPVCTTDYILLQANHSKDETRSSYANRNSWVIWCNKEDGCGLFSAGFTYFLILYAEYCLLFYVLQPWATLASVFSTAVILFYNLVTGLAVISHIKCMTTDPGSIPLNSSPIAPPPSETNQYPFCPYCQYSYKPPRSHHCSTCKRCISRMDHHCPWVNNCVGIANQKYFILFCFYIAMMAVILFTCIISRFMDCEYNNIAKCFDSRFYHDDDNYSTDELAEAAWKELNSGSVEASVNGMANMIVLIMLALIFGLFTFVMMLSQIYSIGIDSTQIEQWKKSREQYYQRTKMANEKQNMQVQVPIAQPANSLNHSNNNEGNSAENSVTMRVSSITSPIPQPKGEIYSTALFASYPSSTVDPEPSAAAVEKQPLLTVPTRPAVNYEASDSEIDSASSAPADHAAPFAPPLAPTSFGVLRNIRLIFLGDSHAVQLYASNFLAHPVRFVWCWLHLLLPTAIQFKDYERLLGFTKLDNVNPNAIQSVALTMPSNALLDQQ
jgi:hypothetical protein